MSFFRASSHVILQPVEDFHAELFVDEASRRAIIESHKDCAATGQWPSDHGCSSAAQGSHNQLDLHVEHWIGASMCSTLCH